jgi:hypothetical protein
VKRTNFNFLLISLLFLTSCLNSQKNLNSIEIIEINKNNNWIEILPESYGFNTNTVDGPSWNDIRFLNMIQGLNPGNMRYPGGTVGNYMNWRTGQFMDYDARDPNRNKVRGTSIGHVKLSQYINTYRPEEFKNAIDLTGSTPIYMVNILTDTLGSILEMLEHCKKIGLQIKYVELGNEMFFTYYPGGNFQNKILGDYANQHHFPTSISYAEECNKWIKAIKNKFPDVEISYNVVYGKYAEEWYQESPRSNQWNKTMLNNIKGTDRVTLHHYAVLAQQKTAVDGLKFSLDSYRSCFKFIRDSLIGKKVWFTEYNNKGGNVNRNPETPENPWSGRWIHGMNASLLTCMMLTEPQVELHCIHNLVSSATIALITAKDYIIPSCPENNKAVTIKAFEYTASGSTHVILGKVLNRASKVKWLAFDNNPRIPVTHGELDAIYGIAIDDKDGQRLMLYNFSDKYHKVSLGEFSILSVSNSYFMSSLVEPVTGFNSIMQKQDNLQSGKVLLKPFSITVVM